MKKFVLILIVMMTLAGQTIKADILQDREIEEMAFVQFEFSVRQ